MSTVPQPDQCKLKFTQIRRDLPKLLKGGFEAFDDLLGEDIRGGKVVGFFEVSSLSQKMSRLGLS